MYVYLIAETNVKGVDVGVLLGKGDYRIGNSSASLGVTEAKLSSGYDSVLKFALSLNEG